MLILSMTVATMPVAVAQTESSEVDSDAKAVSLAHRKVSGEDVLSGIAVVDIEELAAKSYNTSSMDGLKSLIGGWTGSSLWGYDSSLVLIDGFERSAYSITANEIESITFLKGAAAVALYGTRAANGVILINSKRGEVSELQVTTRVNTGFYLAKAFPEYLGSAEYMTYYNQARQNDNLGDLYSALDIYNYASGEDPYRYPDVDLYSSDYINSFYNRTEASVDMRGGTEKTRYYSNIGYVRNGDYLNFGEAKKAGSNQLNIRGNVDLKMSDIVSAYASASVTIADSRAANLDYWSAASTMRPNRISPLIPISAIAESASDAFDLLGTTSNIVDGEYFLGGSQLDQTNIIAEYYAGGYSNNVTRTFQFNTGLDIDLSGVTQGLKFSGDIAIDYTSGYKTSYDDDYAIFAPTWSNFNGVSEIVSLTQYGNDMHSGEQNVEYGWMSRMTTGNVKFSYERSFGEHNVSSLAVASASQNVITGEYHYPSSANASFQAAYNYNHKYYAEFVGTMVHSAKFAKGNRGAFAPSFTLGWNIAREDFLSGTVVNDLMLSASLAQVNSDLTMDNYYAHAGLYDDLATFSWYDGPYLYAYYPIWGENEELTFVKRNEATISLRGTIANKLDFDLSAYYSMTKGDYLYSSTLYPSYFELWWPDASMVPVLNYNDDLYKGIDFRVNYRGSVSEWKFDIGVVGRYVDTKAVKRDENYADAYQNRQGQSLNAMWGLVSDGLYADEDDILNSATPSFGDVQPGDIKYVDQNGDNVINENDQVVIGNWVAPLNMGLNLTLKWRNFTLFALASASFGGDGMASTSYDWVYGDLKYSAVVRNSWTAESADTATYPRLTTTSSDNNFRSSDFWIYDSDRFDLDKVQLTYDFPSTMFTNSWVQGLSAYVSGSSLLTIAPEKERYETNYNGGAPYARFVNLGIKATF